MTTACSPSGYFDLGWPGPIDSAQHVLCYFPNFGVFFRHDFASNLRFIFLLAKSETDSSSPRLKIGRVCNAHEPSSHGWASKTQLSWAVFDSIDGHIHQLGHPINSLAGPGSVANAPQGPGTRSWRPTHSPPSNPDSVVAQLMAFFTLLAEINYACVMCCVLVLGSTGEDDLILQLVSTGILFLPI